MDVDAELYGNPSETAPATTTTEASSDAPAQPAEGEKRETVSFSVNFNKKSYPIEWPLDDTILSLRNEIFKLTGVPAALQKLMFKGLVKENTKTLRETGIGNGAKLMLVGSTMTQVIDVNTTPQATVKEEEAPKQEPLCEQKKHQKILEKGVPDNAHPGIVGRHEPLPQQPLVGVYNNRGTPVRLTFKVYSQELWISSSTSTQQLPFGSIKSVTSEPIKGKEEYHIMTLQLGSSDTTKYYLYYVPAQFTRAIKNTVLGYI